MWPRWQDMLVVAMRELAAAVLVLACFGCGVPDPPPEQLFNGSDLTGWRHVGPGQFTVEDGALKTVGGMGLLVYEGRKLGNSVIRIVYKPDPPDSNAGVFIRMPEQPHDPWFAVHKGYEVQIQDSGDEFHRTGSLYSLAASSEFPPSDDGWNTMEVFLEGQTTTIEVNGEVVNVFEGGQEVPERTNWFEPQRGPRPDEGFIGLQNHDEASTVYFREVSVRPLAP